VFTVVVVGMMVYPPSVSIVLATTPPDLSA
jgi:hypothetical protein